MKCQSCGGDSSPEASFCHYCGSALTRKSIEELSREQSFAKIRASHPFQQALSPERVAKLPKFHGFQKAIFTIAPILIIAIAAPMIFVPLFLSGLFTVVGISSRTPWGGFVGIVPLILIPIPMIAIGFGFYIFHHLRGSMNKMENAPVKVEPAIVVGKRTHIFGSGGESSTSTRYYVTFELEDGSRQEYALWHGTMYGRIAEEDAGVLFTRGDYAADFDRVAV